MPKPKVEHLLSPAEAQAFLGLSESRLHVLAQTGRLTCYRARDSAVVKIRGGRLTALYALRELKRLKKKREADQEREE